MWRQGIRMHMNYKQCKKWCQREVTDAQTDSIGPGKKKESYEQ